MKFFKFLVPLLLVSCCSGAWPAQAEVWSTTNEGNAGATGSIENSSAPSTIDDHIRQTRQQVRKRMGVEHHFGDGDGTADDNGMHRLGSAKCYFQATAPTSLNDSQTSADIALYDNTTETEYTGSKDLNDLANNAASHLENDVGTGRCWIDSDDNNQLYIYRGVAGNDTPSTIAEGWEPVNQARGYINLIANSSFENTSGAGDVAAGDVIPVGWTATAGASTYSYEVPGELTEGPGIALITTNDVAGTDEGVSQILGGLKASTQYRFVARVMANSGSTCQIAVTGQGSVIPSAAEATTTTTAAFETISLLATTDATPTDLVFIIRAETTSDVCTWAQVAAYEVTPTVALTPPGILFFQHTNSPDGNCAADDYTATACEDLAHVIVTPPGPGYHAIIFGSVQFNATADGAACYVEIWNGSAQLAESYYNSDGSIANDPHLFVRWITPAPLVAGTPITYTLRGKDSGGNCTTINPVTLDVMLVRGS